MTTEERWKESFQLYCDSLAEFSNSLQKTDYSVLERAGLIQLYNLSFELAWKTLKDYLSYHGYDVKSPRDIIRTAFRHGTIDDAEIWLEALAARNKFIHQYSIHIAEDSIAEIKQKFAPLFMALENSLRGLL